MNEISLAHEDKGRGAYWVAVGFQFYKDNNAHYLILPSESAATPSIRHVNTVHLLENMGIFTISNSHRYVMNYVSSS